MGKTEYSFDGLDGFDKALFKLANEKYPRAFEQEVKKIAHELHARVKELTPIDTQHLRDHWKVGTVKRIGDEYIIEVYNNTNYSGHVEHGHRTKNGGFVEGAHMMQISLEEVQQRLPNELKQWLDDFIARNPL